MLVYKHINILYLNNTFSHNAPLGHTIPYHSIFKKLLKLMA